MPSRPGQAVVFSDDVGIVWFGIIVGRTTRRLGRRAIVTVRVGSDTVEIADRDVIPWTDHENSVETRPHARRRLYNRYDKLMPGRTLSSDLSSGARAEFTVNLGEIVMVVEAMNPNSRDRVLPGELGVVIGRISATEFVLHLSTGAAVRANAHQIMVYQSGLPEFVVPHMNQADARDTEPGPDNPRDLDS